MLTPAILLNPKLLIGVGVAVAVASAWIYIGVLRSENSTLKQNNLTLQVANDRNIKALKDIRSAHEKQNKVIANLNKKNQQAEADLSQLLDELNHVPASKNGPVAATLRDGLDQLRR